MQIAGRLLFLDAVKPKNGNEFNYPDLIFVCEYGFDRLLFPVVDFIYYVMGIKAYGICNV